MKRKVIFDCDPGHDDVFAILTAHAHPEYFDILGITTVAGNQTVEKVTNNILNVEEYVGLDYPVSVGYDAPLVKAPEPQPLAHGESGLDGFVFNPHHKQVTGMHAVDFIKKQLEENDLVTIIALAPLTNIAVVVKTYPELCKKIEAVVLMGGGIGRGNIQTMSEFNIYHDPEAANIVFNSDVKVVMAPLEACSAGDIYLKEFEAFNNEGHVQKMIYGLAQFYSQYAVQRNWEKTSIFDVLPVIYLMKPEIFETVEMNVDVELDGKHTRGMTVCDGRLGIELNEHTTTVMTSVDRDEFIRIFIEAIKSYDA